MVEAYPLKESEVQVADLSLPPPPTENTSESLLLFGEADN
jgi:hypothetical protein|tara:strand:- start:638 stop:757 length:120 start_codon:yes stop_codon:yes gene_type:complete